MPPKTTQKDAEDSVSHLLMEKLRENQEQQDARHAVITTVLHNITDRLIEIRSYLVPRTFWTLQVDDYRSSNR
ncbi:hypothetical protein Lal_00041086 [Lupinus albus]|nr:hypothetical protein Lal_00041086 [Lupinus albus]